MALGTQSSKLLVRDGALQTGCACCGDGICECVSRMPSAVTIGFSGFTYSFIGGSAIPPDMSTYASELAAFQESYQLTISRTQFVAGSHADYSLQEQCYNTVACQPVEGCTNTELEFLSIASLTLRINCDETLTRLEWNLVSSRACWNQFPSNLENGQLRVMGGVEGSGLSNLFSSFPISAAYPFCDGESWNLSIAAPNNSPVIGQTNFYSQWIDNSGFGSYGNYVATAGTVTIAPIFDNPLP